MPVVDQVHVDAPQSRCSVHVLLPGARSQKRYCGLAQGVAEPVKVTDAPGVCGDGEPGVMSAEVHAPAGSVYVPSQYAS